MHSVLQVHFLFGNLPQRPLWASTELPRLTDHLSALTVYHSLSLLIDTGVVLFLLFQETLQQISLFTVFGFVFPPMGASWA